MDENVKIGLWLLFLAAVVLGVVIAITRKPKPAKGQEQEHPHNPGGGDPWKRSW